MNRYLITTIEETRAAGGSGPIPRTEFTMWHAIAELPDDNGRAEAWAFDEGRAASLAIHNLKDHRNV